MPTKRSRVHPKYKTQYRVSNWSDYDQALAQRGNITLWLAQDAIDHWNAKPTKRRGGQPKYSDLAIETTLTLRLLLHLPLRQTEGFLVSIFELMAVPLDVPDHTTLSRRSARLDLPLHIPRGPGSINLVVDSRGLAIFGEGEWAAAKHGGKGIQGWRKLQFGVDDTGVIVAQTLTDANTDDATTAIELLDAVPGNVSTLIADAAYHTRPFYAAGRNKGARVVVPPVKNAKAKSPRARHEIARSAASTMLARGIGRPRYNPGHPGLSVALVDHATVIPGTPNPTPQPTAIVVSVDSASLSQARGATER